MVGRDCLPATSMRTHFAALSVPMSRLTLFLANPSNMTSAQVIAIAAHKLSSTFVLGVFKILRKKRFTAMVITTEISEIEQPIIEMISSPLRT